jgi:hypothetical protein
MFEGTGITAKWIVIIRISFTTFHYHIWMRMTMLMISIDILKFLQDIWYHDWVSTITMLSNSSWVSCLTWPKRDLSQSYTRHQENSKEMHRWYI